MQISQPRTWPLCLITLAVPMLLGATGWAQGGAAKPKITKFGDWAVRCVVRKDALPCDAIHTIIDKNSGRRVLNFSIAFNPKGGKYALALTLPLGIGLEKGIDMQIGTYAVRGVKVKRCEITGCFVEALLGKEFLDALKSSDAGKVVVYGPNKESKALGFSLKGYAKANKFLVSETRRLMK